MGTRSYIGIENPDGTVDYIYSHWDGYPEHNGKILRDHYASERRARELILMGGISILDREIGTKHLFHTRPEGQCTFYHRDRDETLELTKGVDREKYLYGTDIQIEWRYLWTKDGWIGIKGRNSYNLETKVLPINELIEASKSDE